MDIIRKSLPEQPYLYIEREVPMSEIGAAMADMIPRLFKFLGAEGIRPASMPLSIYPEMPGSTVRFRSAVLVSADDAAKAKGDVQSGTMPAREVMTAVHVGPYDKLGASHQALWKRMETEGLTGGEMWEIYVDDPQQTPPENLRTEIYRAIV